MTGLELVNTVLHVAERLQLSLSVAHGVRSDGRSDSSTAKSRRSFLKSILTLGSLILTLFIVAIVRPSLINLSILVNNKLLYDWWISEFIKMLNSTLGRRRSSGCLSRLPLRPLTLGSSCTTAADERFGGRPSTGGTHTERPRICAEML